MQTEHSYINKIKNKTKSNGLSLGNRDEIIPRLSLVSYLQVHPALKTGYHLSVKQEGTIIKICLAARHGGAHL
ncbi:hypothetical protein I79_013449 [Cricetulus griseus]|uniref:Uncharacterized protein n=1 Tax=Cricetulus griseus TaxID=10029 RepID=G3HRH8_CRIGR|nr:hypothetical protein I79_013449 [Cricetulus griseus]